MKSHNPMVNLGSDSGEPDAEGQQQTANFNSATTGNVAGRDLSYYSVHVSPQAVRPAAGTFSVALPQRSETVPIRGRDQLVGYLTNECNVAYNAHLDNSESRVHLLQGLGGCGKTAVAWLIAQQAAEAGILVWWIQARDQSAVSTCLREVATRLDGDSARVAHAWSGDRSAPDVLWQLLDSTQQPWMLVFDNVEDTAVLNPASGNASDGTGWLRKPNNNGFLLVTSRNGDPARWGTWVTCHRLQPLTPMDGAQVLLDYAGDQAGTLEEAAALSIRLGGLPLALRAAGSYIATVSQSPEWLPELQASTFQDYLNSLRDRFTTLGDIGGITENLGLEIVHQTVELSLELLSATDQQNARLLLELFSQLADAPIPYAKILRTKVVAEDPIFASLSVDQLRRVIGALSSLSLIDLRTVDEVDDPTVSRVLTIHPIVRDVALLRQSYEPKQLAFLGLRAIHTVAVEIDPEDPHNWGKWQLIASHCNHQIYSSITRVTSSNQDKASEIVCQLGLLTSRYLNSIGLYQQAERVLLNLLAHRIITGSSISVALAVRHELTKAYAWQGRWLHAEQECRAVLAARRKTLGPLHPDTLATWHNLAAILAGKQSSLQDAEKEYRAVLRTQFTVLGTDHPDYLNSFHGLAYTLSEQGLWESAETAYKKVINSRVEILGLDHPATLWTLHELAACADEKGRWTEARNMFNEVVGRRGMVLGFEHPDTLISRGELAGVLARLGDIENARLIYDEVLRLQIRVLGDRHPDTLATKHNLAWLLGLERRWKEAEEMSRHVYHARLRELGDRDRDTLASLHNLAVAAGRQERLEEAHSLLSHTWEERRRILGATHPETLTTQHEIANLLADQRRYDEAARHYDLVFKNQMKLLGAAHPDVALTHENIRLLTIEQSGQAGTD
ncbi:MAG: tetratricopeptide repeat protein [Pseudonocardiaceae bacterium]